MSGLEQRTYRPDRRAGAAHALFGVTAATAAGMMVPTSVATWVATGGRSLHETAQGVARALDDDDLHHARELLSSLVGRDPHHLDHGEVARATIESVAENTVDAIVAPALWGALAGGPGVLIHRAVDTLDSMVGYRDDRYADFGWASARSDDLAAWLPARVTVALALATRPQSAWAILHAVRHDAPAHPSPNSGLAEAAFAGALDLTLGGPTTYRGSIEGRPMLGSGHRPTAEDIGRAVSLSQEITTALGACLAGYGIARLISASWRRSR